MTPYLLRRLLHAVLVLWLAATLVFVFMHVSPVPVERIIGGPRATAETLSLIRADLGLDRPLIVRYWRFAERLLRGDLGDSYITGTPVPTLIAARLPTTLCLIAGGSVLWFAGGVALGVLGAARNRGRWDRASTVLVLAALSTPPFVLALALLHLPAALPGGAHLFEAGPPLQENFLRRMALPWATLALLMLATYTRLTRGAMLDVLGQDYVRTARAKGLPERDVVGRHALRPALTPVVSQFGIDLGTLVGSTIVIEKVFGLQGVGQLVHRSITTGDTPVIIGVTLLVTLFVITANLLVDLAYPLLDPRVRRP